MRTTQRKRMIDNATQHSAELTLVRRHVKRVTSHLPLHGTGVRLVPAVGATTFLHRCHPNQVLVVSTCMSPPYLVESAVVLNRHFPSRMSHASPPSPQTAGGDRHHEGPHRRHLCSNRATSVGECPTSCRDSFNSLCPSETSKPMTRFWSA